MLALIRLLNVPASLQIAFENGTLHPVLFKIGIVHISYLKFTAS